MYGLLHVKSHLVAKRPPAGMVRKVGEGVLRCLPRHLTAVKNCEVHPETALMLILNGMLMCCWPVRPENDLQIFWAENANGLLRSPPNGLENRSIENAQLNSITGHGPNAPERSAAHQRSGGNSTHTITMPTMGARASILIAVPP
ncbi:hypothetical protein AVEN_69389-1 [Araneus ventricosus]|uniref:Uncharacterized protein n=1 Tax=Araneus ventricosus TaxID=182803 RepID=A0A4Y2UCY5_ARAVE|nr:hypothetical protein AVEN_256267-1 [Araneus ventricosus]GBO09872.1 hypothetical protein AVEN_69389-1 [Araneus ventricosus]